MIGFAVDGFNENIAGADVQGIGPAVHRNLLVILGEFFEDLVILI